MALAAYDATRHHIGLGISGSEKGFLIEGGYREMLQNAPRVSEFGSPNDLVEVPSLSRWTMDDFLGGAYFPTWTSQDPTVFGDCKNYFPALQGRGLRTVPPLALFDDETGGSAPVGPYIHSTAHGDSLIMQFEKKVITTKISDLTRTERVSLGGTVGNPDRFMGPMVVEGQSDYGYPVLWLPIDRTNGGGLDDGFRRYRLDTWVQGTFYENPGQSNSIYATCGTFEGIVPIFCFTDQTVWTLTFGALETDAPTWTKLGKLSGVCRQVCAYNGLVYLLFTDTAGVTRIVTTDGSSLVDLLTFPFNFTGRTIFSYGGRLYVGGDGIDIGGTSVYAELYEVTGSTLRLIKTFYPEANISGASGFPKDLVALAVYEGVLFLGVSGSKLVMYDLSTDALYGGSEIPASGGTLTIRNLAAYRNQLFVNALHSSDDAKTGWYRIAQSGDTVSSFAGELVTGDFGPAVEPALGKRWSELHVLTRYDNNNPTVDYSVDGGSNWTAASVVVTTSGIYKKTVADLSPAPESPQIRFRIKQSRGTTVTNYAELLAFTATFALLETGKRSWALTLTGAEWIEDLQGDVYEQDVDLMADTLWGWCKNRDELVYKDLHGDTFKVQLINLQEHLPAIGEKTPTGYEGYYTATLVEV